MKEGPLSHRQRRILEFVKEFLRGHGYPPSIRDIQRACDISSTSVVDYNLSILERDGVIRRDPEVSRGIELLDGFGIDGNRLRVPLLGIIAAGDPIPVPSQDSWIFTDTIELPEPFLSSGDNQSLYALRVKGLSMIDALVADGDVVIVDAKSALKDGDMIVAWLKTENEVTLKKMYVEESHVRLQPANPLMDPIFVDYGNLEVQGKVVGVLRNIV
jgi:repressor LexA